MKNLQIILLSIMIFVLPITSYSDGHEGTSPLFYLQSFGFVTDKPSEVVGALDSWRESETGRTSPTSVSLVRTSANGEDKTTHILDVTYPNAKTMDAVSALVADNEEWSDHQDAMNALTEPTWQAMFSVLKVKANSGDISGDNPTSVIYDFTVTDASGFLSAFNVFWNSATVQNFPGYVNFGETLSAGTKYGTHFIGWAANTRGELLEAMENVRSSEDLSKYMKDASGTTNMEAVTMQTRIKQWDSQE